MPPITGVCPEHTAGKGSCPGSAAPPGAALSLDSCSQTAGGFMHPDIQAACRQYQQALHSGEGASLEAVLAQVPPNLRAEAFKFLMQIELQHAGGATALDVQDDYRRFPAYAAALDEVLSSSAGNATHRRASGAGSRTESQPASDRTGDARNRHQETAELAGTTGPVASTRKAEVESTVHPSAPPIATSADHSVGPTAAAGKTRTAPNKARPAPDLPGPAPQKGTRHESRARQRRPKTVRQVLAAQSAGQRWLWRGVSRA